MKTKLIKCRICSFNKAKPGVLRDSVINHTAKAVVLLALVALYHLLCRDAIDYVDCMFNGLMLFAAFLLSIVLAEYNKPSRFLNEYTAWKEERAVAKKLRAQSLRPYGCHYM